MVRFRLRMIAEPLEALVDSVVDVCYFTDGLGGLMAVRGAHFALEDSIWRLALTAKAFIQHHIPSLRSLPSLRHLPFGRNPSNTRSLAG